MRISEDMKVQINELYLKLGVKSQVAKELGISPASVTRYLIPNYKPASQQRKLPCAAAPKNASKFIDEVFGGGDYEENFIRLTMLTEDEKKELDTLREEYIAI